MLGGRGAMLAAGAIAALIAGLRLGFSLEEARTAMFGALVLGHLLYAYVARLPTTGLRSNPRLVGAVLFGVLLQSAAMVLPFRPTDIRHGAAAADGLGRSRIGRHVAGGGVGAIDKATQLACRVPMIRKER